MWFIFYFLNKSVQNNASTVLAASRGRHYCCLLSNRLQNRHLAARHRPACDIHSNPLCRTEKERRVRGLSVVGCLLVKLVESVKLGKSVESGKLLQVAKHSTRSPL